MDDKKASGSAAEGKPALADAAGTAESGSPAAEVPAGPQGAGRRGRRVEKRGPPPATAVWRAAVEGRDNGYFRRPPPAPQTLRSMLYAWLVKKYAVRHAMSVAATAHEEGRFDDLDRDLVEAAPECLRFLARGLQLARECKTAAKTTMLRPPYLDSFLADRLEEMVNTLCAKNCSWRWDIDDISDVQVDRVFLIIGGLRTGPSPHGLTDILFAFGQQFVLSREQTKKFLAPEARLQARMAILQELMFSDFVFVADVSMTAKQRSVLACPRSVTQKGPPAEAAEGTSCGAEAPEEREAQKGHELVEHRLRLEMQFLQERQYSDDGLPIMRASAWQIVDWNGVCLGNHPALPRDRPAPW